MANKAYIPAGETDYAVPPGETLLENIEVLGMNQRELADRMGMAPKTINEIIKGKAPITPETASKLESVVGIKAAFWLNMEANYQASLLRIAVREQIEQEIPIASQFPYAEMSNKHFVPQTRNRHERVTYLRAFFRVASLEKLDALPLAVCFRRKETRNDSCYALMAWLQEAERIVEDIHAEPYSAEALRKALPQLRELSSCPEGFAQKVIALCAQCGVVAAFVPHLKGTSVNGATRWLTPTKALVAVSLRHAYADIFWFSFFHELGHILKGHSKKDVYISSAENDPEKASQEAEADSFAQSILIPKEHYEGFVAQNNFTPQAVADFAESISIHPGIVWGRLAKEGHIDWSRINKYRMKLSFTE